MIEYLIREADRKKTQTHGGGARGNVMNMFTHRDDSSCEELQDKLLDTDMNFVTYNSFVPGKEMKVMYIICMYVMHLCRS